VLLISAWIGSASVAFGQAAGTPVPGRYIVVLKANANAAAFAANNGVVPDHLYSAALNGLAGPIPAGRLAALARNQQVAWIEQDQIVTANAQTIPTGVDRLDAELSATAKIDGLDERVDVDVAVIDSGIELAHPDLYVFKNVTFVRGTKSGNDDYGHGTHVAGTVAALDNSFGVVGVAPGARLWAVKVIGKNGLGWMSDILKGVDYVAANAAAIEVANMSLGGGNSDALKLAIANSIAKGVVYVVAAGNSADDAANYSPANAPDAITVSAIADSDGGCGGLGADTNYGADDTFASFSNFGSVVDIAAPGVNILSTYRGKTYAVGSGTSMASPHVAGAVALYLATRAKPIDTAGVVAVRDAIVTAGVAQDGTRDCRVVLNPDGTVNNIVGAFVSDPDSSPEPLAYGKDL
ncbi:MAG: S8 family serine peptidase, partial [Verrucomicrobia bacterium]|nr:S8 family serine peptidase [Verrucomicrobiota bacterium]